MATLTRQQFLKVKPGGNYQNYLSYVNSARAAAAKRAALGVMRPNEIRQQALTQAAAELKPGLVALGQQRKQGAAEAAGQEAKLRGIGQAEADALKAASGNVMGAYTQAAGLQGELGSGLSDAVKADLAQKTGAPGEGIASTLAYLGGTLPGATLAKQGLAEATAHAFDPLAAVGRQGDLERQAMYTQKQNDQKIVDAINQLQAKRPDLVNQAINSIQNVNLRNRAQALYEAQYGHKVNQDIIGNRQTQQRLGIEEKNYQLQLTKHQDAIDQAKQEGLQPDASASRAFGWIVDQHGNPILDARGNKIPYATIGGANKKNKSGLTPSQVRTNMRMAGEAARNLLEDSRPGAPAFPGGPATPAKNPLTFSQALSYMVSTYGLQRSVARKLLVGAGWKPDGKKGPNPVVSGARRAGKSIGNAAKAVNP